MLILALELSSYLQVKQPQIKKQEKVIYSSLKSFFSTHICPIANLWISNVSEVAEKEYYSPLTLKINANSDFGEEYLKVIRKLVEKSSFINPEVVISTMQSKAAMFTTQTSFKISAFLPLWWLGVREEWNKNYLTFLVTKIKLDLQIKPSAGFFKLTNMEVHPATLKILQKGPMYIPNMLPNLPQMELFEQNLYTQVVWFSKVLGDKKSLTTIHSNVSSLLENLISSSSGNLKTFYHTILEEFSNLQVPAKTVHPINSTHFLPSPPLGCCWLTADKGY